LFGSVFISRLFKRYTSTTAISFVLFPVVRLEELEKYILENKMEPPTLERESALIEIRDFSFHGITELLKLKNIFTNCEFGFEKDLLPNPQMPVNGRLDIILTCDEGYAVLDFKRSKTSVGNKKQLLDFKKIQPWFYLNHYPMPDRICLFVGYLVLSNPKDSLILCNEKSIQERLKLGDFQGNFSALEDEKIPDISKRFSDYEKQKFSQKK
jgi:hypothetical protein